MQSKSEISSTGNVVLDSIINYKLHDIDKKEIDLDYNASIPVDLFFDVSDLTIIMGNLLDNDAKFL